MRLHDTKEKVALCLRNENASWGTPVDIETRRALWKDVNNSSWTKDEQKTDPLMIGSSSQEEQNESLSLST